AYGPMQPEPEESHGGDRQSVEHRHSGQPGGLMYRSSQDVSAPFPGEPRLAGPRERIRVDPGELTGSEDRLSRTDMPSGVRITKQLLIALKEEKTIEERDPGSSQRQVRQTPPDQRPVWNYAALEGGWTGLAPRPHDNLPHIGNAALIELWRRCSTDRP